MAVTLDQRDREPHPEPTTAIVGTADAVDADVVTVAGLVRSTRRRPWAGEADVVAVVSDGAADVTVVLHEVGPVELTAGVRVVVRGQVASTSSGWVMHDPELRAADLTNP